MKTLLSVITGVVSKSTRLVKRIVQEARDLATATARSPVDNALERVVAELPTPDYELMLEWKSGLRYQEIAQKRGLSEETVLRSLARIYADLRMMTMPIEDPPSEEIVEAKRDQVA